MASIFTRIKTEIEALWEKDKPVLESGLKAVLAAAEPIWKTALGSIVLSTCTNLTAVAAAGGGALAASTAAKQIAVAAEAAGVTAEKSTVNTLIELAMQKLATLAPAPATTPTTPAKA